MTKAELVRKLSKSSGIPDIEAKVFFEILLRKISEKLEYGEAIKLPGSGFYQLREGIIKKTSAFEDGQYSSAATDLIVFSPLEKEGEENNEDLIFKVPEKPVIETDPVDSFFSLSINKPIIPLQGTNDIDYYVQPTGNQLVQLFDSRVEKILEDAEIIKEYNKGNEILVIRTNVIDPAQYELNWEDTKKTGEDSKNDSDFHKESEGTPDIDHVEWDFGENLSKQIEEESILDIDAENNNTVQDLEKDGKELDWNFEPPETNNENDSIENISEPEEKEEIQQPVKEPEPHVNEKDILNTREFEEIVGEELKKFQRVQPLTGKDKDEKIKNPLSLTKSEMDLSWNFNEKGKSYDTTSIEDKETNANKEEKKKEPPKEKPGPFKKDSFVPIVKKKEGDFLNNKPNFNTTSSSDQDGSKIFNSINKKSKEDNRKKPGKFPGGKTSLIFFIALLTIIIIGTALILYLKSNKLGIAGLKNADNKNLSKVNTPEIINRNYDIPVSYPYSKNHPKKNLAFEGIDSSLVFVNKTENGKQKTPGDLKSGTNKKTSSNKIKKNNSSLIKKAGPAIKVDNNIYKSGNNYIVQVSSWKTESIAIEQAKKFKRKGYTSYIEKTLIPGRGQWYRVRIGNFKTLSSAKKFSKRYQ
jgi:nucleoid DNA-binding protein